MAHTICGVCFSLNKSTSYLSLCLSLNSFCIETSRTWASLSLETKCETVGSSSNLSYMVSASGFIICLTEQRTHLPWNWKTQILSGKGYSKHKTTYIRLELSFKFEWLSPVKSLLMCEWKAREFRKASGEKNNPRSQQDFKRKLHFTSSHVCVCVCVCVCVFPCASSRVQWILSNSMRPRGLQPTRLFCPRDYPGKNTGVGCHLLLQGIFLIQGSNPHLLCLLHWQALLLSQLKSHLHVVNCYFIISSWKMIRH